MQGKIIKGIAGFYYVYAEDGNTYECRAKGIFRKDKFKPLVGDNVDITVLDEKELEGSVTEIHKRKNSLIRPAVANVDQALVIFAMDNPKPNFMLLDRFLIMMEREGVPAVICFNKKDLATTEELEFLYETYQSCGYQVILSSALKGEGLDEIEEVLQGRTTVVAGPSGVGKSSLTNSLQEEVEMETGEISRKLKRGKHTTRHAQIIPVAQDTFLVDTPGFSSLYIENMEEQELKDYFPEFRHISLRDCADYFNSRPHGGRQEIFPASTQEMTFQLTPSRRATRAGQAFHRLSLFQLTPSRRATIAFNSSMISGVISTHALTEGDGREY